MFEETTLGALVSPDGRERNVHTITQNEFDELEALLNIIRYEPIVGNHQPVDAYILSFLEMRNPPATPHDIVDAVCQWMKDCDMTDMRPSTGGLFDDGDTCERLTGRETRDLHEYLTVLRRGGWYPLWLSRNIFVAATAKEPIKKFPTPLAVMAQLTLDVGEYDVLEKSARDFVQKRPDRFADLLPGKEEPTAAK